MKQLFLIVSLSLASGPAFGKLFKNAYVSFELPSDWDCTPENTEWVCRSVDAKSKKEAIIVLTAKEAGPSDTLAAYMEYLKKPRAAPSKKGRPVPSVLKNLKMAKVNSHDWVDSLHLGSEIPGYYTRYLATVQPPLAILVTFSAHQKYYTRYSDAFFRAVQSLHALANKDVLKKDVIDIAPPQQPIGQNITQVIPQDMESGEDYPPEPDGSDRKTKFLGLAVILIALGAYFYLKKKKS